MARSNATACKPKAAKAGKSSTKGSGGTGPKTPVVLVLGQFKNMGTERPSRQQLSQISGYPFHSLSTTLLNIKKKKGYVDYDKSCAWLTEEGWEFAQKEYGDKVSKQLDQSSIHSTLIQMHKLTGAKLRIFELLKDSKEPMSIEVLMEHVGLSNQKSFLTYMSALNSAGLTQSVVESGTKIKKYRLVEATCFPLGRI